MHPVAIISYSSILDVWILECFEQGFAFTGLYLVNLISVLFVEVTHLHLFAQGVTLLYVRFPPQRENGA